MDALSDDDFVGDRHRKLLCVLRGDQAHLPTAAHQRKIKMLQCSRCPHKAFTKHYLRQHMKEHAKERCCNLCAFTSTSLQSVHKHMKAEHKNSDLACKRCSYMAVTEGALRKHEHREHCKEVRKNFVNFCCREELPETGASGRCQASFHYRKELRKHLTERHSLESAAEKMEVRFTSKEKFALWKEDYERKNCVYYLRMKPQSGVTMYQCSRSGVHTPTGSGKRRTKSQGSAKLGFSCTSTLHVTERSGGALAVVLYTFHYGHDTGVANMPYIRIPAGDRAVAKEKLAAGVSTSRVMNDLRDYHSRDSEAGLNRTSRIQRKDLINMCKSLGITPGDDNTKDPNEVISVQTHAEELQTSDKRHAAAAELVAAGCATAAPVADSVLPTWYVRSSTDGTHQLNRVERQHRQCPESSCQHRCKECRACTHMFRCQCPDWVLHKGMCKHVHIVCMQGVVSDKLAPAPDVTVPDDASGALPPPSDRAVDSAAVGLRRLCAGLDELKAQVSSLPDDTSDAALALMSAKLREFQKLIACLPTPISRVTVVTLPTATERQTQPLDTKIRPQPSFESRRAKRPRAHVTGRTVRQRVNRSVD